MKTTDNQDEIFPIVNEKDEVIGKTTRGDANSNPDIIHRAVGILIYNPENKLLLQKRSMTKDTSPGCWTLGASGHVEYGEEYLPTAVREIEEETGLEISEEDLTSVGKILVRMPWENEYYQVYKIKVSEGVQFKTHPDEVSELKFVSDDELKSMIEDLDVCWSPPARETITKLLLKSH